MYWEVPGAVSLLGLVELIVRVVVFWLVTVDEEGLTVVVVATVVGFGVVVVVVGGVEVVVVGGVVTVVDCEDVEYAVFD